jgi:hypothetical protein
MLMAVWAFCLCKCVYVGVCVCVSVCIGVCVCVLEFIESMIPLNSEWLIQSLFVCLSVCEGAYVCVCVWLRVYM